MTLLRAGRRENLIFSVTETMMTVVWALVMMTMEIIIPGTVAGVMIMEVV